MAGNSNSPTTKAAILDTDAPLLINTFNGPPSRDRGTQRSHPRRFAKKASGQRHARLCVFGDSVPFDMEAIKLAARQIGTVRKQHAYLITSSISGSLTATRTVGER